VATVAALSTMSLSRQLISGVCGWRWRNLAGGGGKKKKKKKKNGKRGSVSQCLLFVYEKRKRKEKK